MSKKIFCYFCGSRLFGHLGAVKDGATAEVNNRLTNDTAFCPRCGHYTNLKSGGPQKTPVMVRIHPGYYKYKVLTYLAKTCGAPDFDYI